MKGQATIIVKDKEGNIKQQVTENNVVFDIPKELIKQVLSFADLGEINTTTTSNGATIVSSYSNNPISVAFNYKNWFDTIYLYDEPVSEVDYKDWKIPVLYGGEYNKAYDSNYRYTKKDSATSTTLPHATTYKQVFTWANIPQAFQLKGLSLKHQMASDYIQYASNFPFCINYDTPSIYELRKIGNFYYRPCQVGSYLTNPIFGNLTWNTLYTKSTFSWKTTGGNRNFTGIQVGYISGSSQYTNAISVIYSLRKNPSNNNHNEIAVLSELQYSDSILTSTSTYIKYINIIDADTGEIKRSFPLTQFDEFVGYSASNHYMTPTNIRIISTDFGNFLLTRKTMGSSDYNFYLWQIPDSLTDSTIPLYVTDAVISGGSTGNVATYIQVLNEYIFNSWQSKTIRLNDVSEISEPTDSDKITTYNYVPFNRMSSIYTQDYYRNYATYSKYYDLTCNSSTYECWYNTTALNISQEIQIAQGDTLTVEYTITAN